MRSCCSDNARSSSLEYVYVYVRVCVCACVRVRVRVRVRTWIQRFGAMGSATDDAQMKGSMW